MKKVRWGIIIFMTGVVIACSTAQLDPNENKPSAREDHPRTFNQFRNEWDY